MSSSVSNSDLESDVGNLRRHPLRIPFNDIVSATNNFDEENRIKKGGSADVYKGQLPRSDARVVIWKFHIPLPWYQEIHFLSEVKRLHSLKHRNVASLIGFCDANEERMIVMEYVSDRSLDNYLSKQTLTWCQRLHICHGAALALSYLYDSSRYFCGIKSSKVLLDENWEAKVCCIISLHLGPGDTRPEGDESSLRQILFDVLSGRKETVPLYEKGELDDMIAPYLRKQMHTKSLSIFLEIAYKCFEKDRRYDMTISIPEELKKALELLDNHDKHKRIAEKLKEALELQKNHDKHVEDLVENLACLKIPLSYIKLVTDEFADRFCIKSHRDEKVYKAELDHNGKGKIAVVIKRIINLKYRTRTDFYAELELLAGCKHDNLVPLLGFCDEDPEMILVFEYSFEQTLDYYLGSTSNKTNLTWEQRIRICLDIARGLKYLHTMEGKQSQGMIHQGILSANVTLDKNWKAKIANFRLSKFDLCPKVLWQSRLENFRSWLWEDNDAHLIPSHKRRKNNRTLLWEYRPWYLESKDEPLRPSGQRLVVDDIYSIGVILFEILTGRLAYDPFYMADDFNGLASKVREQRELKNMTDRRILEEAREFSYTKKIGPDQYSWAAYSKIAYQCVAQTPSERPILEDVIKSLEKALHFQVENFLYMTIPLKDIKLATNNFDEACLIGSGGYGEVYKGELKTNSRNELGETLNPVAIKRIFRKDDQGKEGFFTELDVLTRCQHPNILNLVGFCVEESEWILVYELASNGSLNAYLGSTEHKIYLTWAQCLKICTDIAKGLNYLHTNMEDKRMILHRDIKSDNILLGKNLEAKIADFGLSKFHPTNQHASTINTNHVAGTDFYLDPEYVRTGKLKKASDIYSLGVVLFEIFSGKLANDSSFINENEKGLAPIARKHFEKETLEGLLDPRLIKNAYELGFSRKVGPDHESLDAFSRIAYKCLAKTQGERPRIDVVIEELEKALYIQENAMKSTLKISLEHIKPSVENFSDDNCFMKGGYGRLYEGQVQYNNGDKEVLVKRFSTSSQKDGFLKDFEILYKYQHENIIRLVGYCKENFEKIILYEHASMGSLNRYLNHTSFSWPQRLKICIDIANGLNFLHGGYGGQDVVIHRDMKSSNILLTGDWKAKICGFEQAVTYPANKEIEYVKNDVVGSPGYCDPLYWDTLVLTKESDIYSLGVILFEMLCGRSACPVDLKDCSQFLDVLVKQHFQEARIEEIVFEGIKEHIALKSLITFRRIAFQCLHDERKERPTANEVAVQLRDALNFQEAYDKRESDSAMAKKNIYNILSKGLLLEDDKLEIIQVLQAITRKPDLSVQFAGENDDGYHSDNVNQVRKRQRRH